MDTNGHTFLSESLGFSLTELLYVMVISGILIGMAAPAINLDRFRLDSAVIEVATSFMAAQRSAILRGHDIVVAFDEDQNRLRVHKDANNDGVIQQTEEWKVIEFPEGVVFGQGGAPWLSRSQLPVTFTQKQGIMRALTFHRNGSASEMGHLYLTGQGGGVQVINSRAVEVIRSTARVKCWSYQTNAWQETC